MAETVLIGFAEAVAAPETVFSLTRAGYDVRAFCRTGSGRALHGLPVGDLLPITAPEHSIEQAIADLRRGVGKLGSQCRVLALDDVALWLVDAAFGHGEISVISATGDQAAFALDKTRQLAAARAAGLATPETVIAGSLDEVRQVNRFPAIVKPSLAIAVENGRLVKQPVRYLMDATDRAALPATAYGFPALVQPLIVGVGEGVFGFATAGGVVQWSGHRRVRMMNPHGSGASACTSNPPDETTKRRVAAVLGSIGWRGPFMVEFLRGGDGTLWFMEVNGRLWGSLALARRAGFEYPAWAVAQAADPTFVPTRDPAASGPTTVRHLGRDLLHLLHVLRGPRTAFHRAGWPRFWPTLGAVLRPGRRAGFYNYDPRWPGFFLRDAVAVVRQALRNRQ
jgi:hypothetical protein